VLSIEEVMTVMKKVEATLREHSSSHDERHPVQRGEDVEQRYGKNPDGTWSPCNARPENVGKYRCPHSSHELLTRAVAEEMNEAAYSRVGQDQTLRKRGVNDQDPQDGSWDDSMFRNGYYYGNLGMEDDGDGHMVPKGEWPPKDIQPGPMDETANALHEEGKTQLVAACGTGKSYMGRQLMARMMGEPGSTGIGIVLTSSVALADSTSKDYEKSAAIRDGGHDVDVIEIDTSSKEVQDKNGKISNSIIKERMLDDMMHGRRIILVSTYRSSGRIAQIQNQIAEEDHLNAEAVLLINDEAHNILGQRNAPSKTTGSSGPADDEDAVDDGDAVNDPVDEGVQSYRSFDNRIPGSMLASHRLYMTATPVIQESTSDQPPDVKSQDTAIDDLKRRALEMDDDDRARMVVYSTDSAVVGRVSGFISKNEAVDHHDLAGADYQMIPVRIGGGSKKPGGQLESGLVDDNGDYIAPDRDPRAANEAYSPHRRGMDVDTYASIVSTANALVSDQDDGVNPSHNVLAYCGGGSGGIRRSNDFRDHFKNVVMSMSGDITDRQAMIDRDSSDPGRRRAARLHLLAMNANVTSVTSESTEGERKPDKIGKFFTRARRNTRGWDPHKNIMANVDILSEGVSVDTIDTVVIGDKGKTSERAITQAIGRASRIDPKDPGKVTGHVIIPRAIDGNDQELHPGLTLSTLYGVTRFERSVTAKTLKGMRIEPDDTTVKMYDENGSVIGSRLASDLSTGSITSTEDLVTASILDSADQAMRKETNSGFTGYRDASQREKMSMLRSYVNEKASAISKKRGSGSSSNRQDDDSWLIAQNVVNNHANALELEKIRQEGRIVASALKSGDVSSLNSSIISDLSESGIIHRKAHRVTSGDVDAMRGIIMRNRDLVTLGLVSANNHDDVIPGLSDGVKPAQVIRPLMNMLRGRGYELTPQYHTVESRIDDALKDDSIVVGLYKSMMISTSGFHSIFDTWGGREAGRRLVNDMGLFREEALDADVRSIMDGSMKASVRDDAITSSVRISSKMRSSLSQLVKRS
jgi:superfamily II DNA or RNA helicase